MNFEKDHDIQKESPHSYETRCPNFLCNFTENLKYKNSIFLEQILIDKNPNTAKPVQNRCIVKRYFSTNFNCIDNIIKEEQQSDFSPIKVYNNDSDKRTLDYHIVNSDSTPNNIRNTNTNNTQLCFPHRFIRIDNNNRIYEYLFLITGAYLTQSELLFLRKTLFKNVLPLVIRDEQRSKIKNIECFEKHHEKVISILRTPLAQYTIQNYIFNRRRDFEKTEMILNFEKNYKKRGSFNF